MSGVELLLLFAGSLAITTVARRYGLPAPLVLLAVGLAVSFLPGLPPFDLDPHLILLLILPPLLYSAALDSSYLNIKANLRPIGLLAIALVLVTTVVVGFAAHWLIPSLTLTQALVLGAIVAPPDAVAAVAIGRKLGLPRRVMTLLSGESLGNDATALTAYKVAVAAAVGTGMSFGEGVGIFLLATVGGIAIGFALGWIVHRIRLHVGEPVLESALGLLVPFGAYLIAEELHTSGVLAVVVAGLYLGHNAPLAGYATRLQENAVWRSVDTLLEAMVFALIGLQLRHVVSGGVSSGAFLAALALLLITMAVRVVWMFPVTYLPRLLPSGRAGKAKWRNVAVLSWAGMRGVVSMAAAVALPSSMPSEVRGTILLTTFVITVGTLLIQGLTLPKLIKALGVESDDEQADRLAEAQVKHNAARAAISRLDELSTSETSSRTIERLRALAENRANAVWETLGRQDVETPAAKYRRYRLEMLRVEREAFLTARDAGEIDDEVFRRVQRELDQDEAALDR
jgi:CPA1 family monovalent cation:H+ antiporter